MKTGIEYAFSKEKRAFDLTIAAGASPLRLASGGLLRQLLRNETGNDVDPNFRQVRVGADGGLFYIHKLRTLKSVTREPLGAIPKLFRQLGVDELPQARNILSGEMSAVGYRPIEPYQQEEIFDRADGKLVDKWKRIVSPTKPGIVSTFGLANHAEPDKIAKMIQRAEPKLECDIRDIIDGSLAYDSVLIITTLEAVVRGET